jgi:crossover junction endodeoxyribonuclease RuvC
MKILAIDPGYEKLGIAVLENGELIFSECFKTSPKELHEQRLSKISSRIEEIIKEYKPKYLVTETLFFSKNIKTAIKVAEARGVIIERCCSNGLEIVEFSPQAIKVAVTGNGASNKEQVTKMVSLLTNIKKTKVQKEDDEYDAVAIGLTFFVTQKYL